MAWDHCVALLMLLLLATLGLGQRPHPEPGIPGLRHSYDCGLNGMQLRVFPWQVQTIRFKVVGECQLNPGPHQPRQRWVAGSFPCHGNRKSRGLPAA